MEGVVYAAHCHMQDIACSFNLACSFNHGHQQGAQLQYYSKALKRFILGMVLSSKQ